MDEVTLRGNAITSRGSNSQVDNTGLHLHEQILIMTANVLRIKIILFKSKHTGLSSAGRRICFRDYKPIQGNITWIHCFLVKEFSLMKRSFGGIKFSTVRLFRCVAYMMVTDSIY